MPDISVENAVENMVNKAPKEQGSLEAPVEKTQDKADESKKESTEVTPDDTSKGADGQTPFEKELINELEEDERTEFDGLNTTEKSARLKWMKTRYRRDSRQKTELGNLRKAVGVLKDAGVTQDDLLKLVNDKRSGRPVDEPKGDQKITKRGLAKLIDDAQTPEDREQVTNTRQIMREEIEDMLTERFGKEIDPIKKRLDAEDSRRTQKRSQTLETDINKLEDELGYSGSLIETYRDQMKSLGIRNPDMGAEELLFKVAPPSLIKKSFNPVETNGNAPKTVSRVAKPKSAEPLPKTSRGNTSIDKALDLILRRK